MCRENCESGNKCLGMRSQHPDLKPNLLGRMPQTEVHQVALSNATGMVKTRAFSGLCVQTMGSSCGQAAAFRNFPSNLETVSWPAPLLLLEVPQATNPKFPENKGSPGAQSREGCPSRMRGGWVDEAYIRSHRFAPENELAPYEMDVFQPERLEIVTGQWYLFQYNTLAHRSAKTEKIHLGLSGGGSWEELGWEKWWGWV